MVSEVEHTGEEGQVVEEYIEEFDALSIALKSEEIEKYPARLHAASVAKQLNVPTGLIYLQSTSSVLNEDSDQPLPFRQRRYFYYLSGYPHPDSVVTYSIYHKQLTLWIPPPRTPPINVIFNGQVPTIEEVKAKYDFDRVEYTTKLKDYLAFHCHHGHGKIYVLHENQAPKSIPKTIYYRDGTSSYLSEIPINYTILQPAMDSARVIKSAYELKLLRKANKISAIAHTNVLRSLRQLKNETEIEAIFTATCIANKAKTQAYGVIAGSRPNGATLHYVANDESLKGRLSVVLDAGCEWDCYASDVTRTIPISGEWTKEGKEIYDIVDKMQQDCIDMLAPGTDFRDVQKKAEKVAVEELSKIGLLKNGSVDELLASGVVKAFFPHGLGHYIGLEVHDVGEAGRPLLARSTATRREIAQNHPFEAPPLHTTANPSILKPNMAITVEPGIYFSEYAFNEVYLKSPRFAQYINADLLEKYYPVGGVRIEDDLLITDDGYDNITTAPKGDDALKIINGEEDDNSSKAEAKAKRGWFW
ncbi:xaa-Pro aminopeptidase-like protein I [Xylogone sp. PMI_703]|nr:xaa-Pro aminopeptidase-like protein I [Xylogone sp. PMI_703]